MTSFDHSATGCPIGVDRSIRSTISVRADVHSRQATVVEDDEPPIRGRQGSQAARLGTVTETGHRSACSILLGRFRLVLTT